MAAPIASIYNILDSSSEEEEEDRGLEPRYPSSIVWKSEYVKEEEQFERIKKLVSHVAPQQVPQYQSHGQAMRSHGEMFKILPQTLSEYLQYRIEILEDKIAELNRRIMQKQENMQKESMEDKSLMFVGGRKFEDGRGPLLAQKTVWSREWRMNDYPLSAWPSLEALKADGDIRESQIAPTRCYRKLPLPDTDPSKMSDVRFQDSPLDKIERHLAPQYHSLGLVDPVAAEIEAANRCDDNDLEFLKLGEMLVGGGVLEEL